MRLVRARSRTRRTAAFIAGADRRIELKLRQGGSILPCLFVFI
jgi:hypothetical protein